MRHNLLWVTTFLEGGLAVLKKNSIWERAVADDEVAMPEILASELAALLKVERISGTEKKEINCSSYTEQWSSSKPRHKCT